MYEKYEKMKNLMNNRQHVDKVEATIIAHKKKNPYAKNSKISQVFSFSFCVLKIKNLSILETFFFLFWVHFVCCLTLKSVKSPFLIFFWSFHYFFVSLRPILKDTNETRTFTSKSNVRPRDCSGIVGA